jgi:hypothetical protein
VDDQDDREYSRAPELEDLVSLCQALIETKQTDRPSDAVDVRFLRLRIDAEQNREPE